MKSYFKGLLTGIVATAIICTASAIAENIDVIFNHLRINVNGIDQVLWGEEIALDDETSAPSSILYNGTTYLSIRQIGELLDMDVHWNGDSRTVSITGKKENIRTHAEKPDKNGNLWKYYTFSIGENHYLGVKDEARGYERIYYMADDSVRVTDNEIYFLRMAETGERTDNFYHEDNFAYVTKLSFYNDSDTQDGENLFELGPLCGGQAIFDGDYLYYPFILGGTHCYPAVIALNYITNERAEFNTCALYAYPGKLTLNESNKNNSTLQFEYTDYHTGIKCDTTLKYDKNTNTFVEF